ncbi:MULTISPECIES: LysE family transporter [unclassified Pseudomonas]|uniref:LysE family transporter n=1 Tax=unclassified Pseudomonas TaxID=196821 RepID=UPI002580E622|nr:MULTISPECIES: LysE family transporter [unclassified Pseudomonas]
MLTIFLSAFLFGAAFCLSPGPVLAETLRRGLSNGFRPALMVQVGSLLSDAVWAVLGLVGLSVLLGHEPIRIPLTLLCAVYLAWLGVQSLKDAWRLPVGTGESGQPQQGALMAGAAISLTNPKNIVYWGALGSALSGITGDTPSIANTAMFFSGVMSASILCCFLTAALVEGFRRASSPNWHRASHALCGILLLIMAGLALHGL